MRARSRRSLSTIIARFRESLRDFSTAREKKLADCLKAALLGPRCSMRPRKPASRVLCEHLAALIGTEGPCRWCSQSTLRLLQLRLLLSGRTLGCLEPGHAFRDAKHGIAKKGFRSKASGRGESKKVNVRGNDQRCGFPPNAATALLDRCRDAVEANARAPIPAAVKQRHSWHTHRATPKPGAPVRPDAWRPRRSEIRRVATFPQLEGHSNDSRSQKSLITTYSPSLFAKTMPKRLTSGATSASLTIWTVLSCAVMIHLPMRCSWSRSRIAPRSISARWISQFNGFFVWRYEMADRFIFSRSFTDSFVIESPRSILPMEQETPRHQNMAMVMPTNGRLLIKDIATYPRVSFVPANPAAVCIGTDRLRAPAVSYRLPRQRFVRHFLDQRS